MQDYTLMRSTLRTKLDTLEVCTTGSWSLAASGYTFVRTTGSFLADGFYAGMEVKGSGFSAANNAAAGVVDVAALTLTVDRALASQAASAGRTLTVGFPSQVETENVEFEATPGRPYVEQDFVYGPNSQISLGGGASSGATVMADPLLVLRLNVPEGVGPECADEYLRALFALLTPGLAMPMAGGEALRVRTTPAPFANQTLHEKAGWATTPITFPLRLFTLIS